MGKYIKGKSRGQLVLFEETLEDRIKAEAEARVIDMFVDSINLREMGFQKSEENKKGTNMYDPKDILKLYLYGYRNKVRSSRKLEQLCQVNIEVIWLMRGVTPNFRTIADFRKDNAKALKEVFKKLIIVCNEMGLISRKYSEDGVKIKAVNSKAKNYTLNKIDDKIKRIEEEVEKYLKRLDEEDKKEETEPRLDIKMSIQELEKRLKKYEQMRDNMEKRGVSQISETDEDSKLMKNNGKYEVCYNNQLLEDAESHLTVNYHIGTNPADTGSMEEVTREAKEMLGMEDEIIKNITDKGYKDRKDMVGCLENGVIPEVTLNKEQEYHELEIPYEENEVSEEEKKSTKPEDLKKVLRSGNIPECYKEYIEEIKVVEKEEVEEIEEVASKINELRSEEIRDLAMKEKCFIKEQEGKVYCPCGEILRKKSNHKNGVKYTNKLACKRCKEPCTTEGYKEVIMKKGQVISGKNKKELKNKYEGTKIRKKKKKLVVLLKFKPKEEDIRKRMGISEHPHGTMKVTDDARYLLLKGKEKVTGEMAIYYTASNLRRLINIKGVEWLKEYFRGKMQGINC